MKYLIASPLLLLFIGLNVNAQCSWEEVVVDEWTVYYGDASCNVINQTGPLTYDYCDELSAYVGSHEDPTVTLTIKPGNPIQCYPESGGFYLKYEGSCEADIPNSRVEQETEQVYICGSYRKIAEADINGNDMTVYDSSCAWLGWNSYTMVRENILSCGGSNVAKVVDYTGYPYSDNECYAEFYDDDYSRLNPGSYDTCTIDIVKPN